jgi:hypothetical protein
VDPSPVPGQANCYTVAPVDAAGTPLSLSYWLCRVPGATPSGAPTSFTARMDLPRIRFTWSGPGGQTQYLLVTYFLSNPGFPPRGALFDGASTEGSVSSGSATNCFVLVPLDGNTQMGHSDALCVAPTQGNTQ